MNISAAIGKSRGISKPRAYNVGASIEHCTRNTELFHQQVLWTFSCIARRSRASKLDWFCSAIKERRQQKAYARKLKVWLEKRKEGRKEGRKGGREGGRKGGREGGREGGRKGGRGEEYKTYFELPRSCVICDVGIKYTTLLKSSSLSKPA